MRESEFIRQNHKDWNDSKESSPEKLSDLYIKITSDLSYSKTHYPHRSITRYLNERATLMHSSIYKNERPTFNAFLDYWKIHLPLTLYANRHALYLAFSIFVVGMLIGIFSQMGDPSFFEYLFGSAYTFQTESNIANKDPMAIYKSMGQSEMFSFITINNLMVSFRVFITGILVGIGSIVSLFYEGIRIGAFESFFHQNGVLKESLFTVWLHGTPEISAIIIAGAAGITLGKGLVFPGDKSRFVSFKHSGRESLRIMLATVPIFFLAAFIEGYLTRYTEISYTVRGFIILTSLIAIVFYFVIYPIIIAKSHSKENVIDDRPAISEARTFYGVSSAQEVFNESLNQFLKHFMLLLKWSIFAALAIVTYGVILKDFIGIEMENYTYSGYHNFAIFDNDPGQKVIILISITVFQVFVLQKLSSFTSNIKVYLTLFLTNILLIFFAFTSPLFWLLLLTIIPFAIIFQISLSYNHKIGLVKLIAKSWQLVKNDFGLWLFNVGITFGLILLGSFLFAQLIWPYFLEPSLNFLYLESEKAINMVKFCTTVGVYAIAFLFYSFVLINIRLLYFSLKEINEPVILKSILQKHSLLKNNGF
ncbi:MAG: stage II sporulation protein M [Saprospiraceae bacterium]|nr:stage II sporulation protein M [Saprospiraceae bacterium]